MNKINRLAVSDEGFIFDPERGDSYTTNVTGLRILTLLREGLDPETIVNQLAGEYSITPHEARQDLTEFTALLRANNLWDGDDE